jgi:hypothetical protein
MNKFPQMDRVSHQNPCPSCGKPDWCLIAPDGSACICQRVESDTDCGDAGWLHKFDEVDGATGFTGKPGRIVAPISWAAEARRYERSLHVRPHYRTRLAANFGVPVSALSAIPLIGIKSLDNSSIKSFDTTSFASFTIPEMNEKEGIIGLAVRKVFSGMKSEKSFIRGGHRGLILPSGWLDRNGPIFVVEGPSDVIALNAAGLRSIGRPSNTGGNELLAKLFAGKEEELFIVGENDCKDNGDWPGRFGAETTAKKLAEKIGRPVKMTMPPEGAKDVRAWLIAPAQSRLTWPQRGEELSKLLLSHATTVHGPIEGVPVQLRAKVLVDTDEFRVNREASAALALVPGLYKRGGKLVVTIEQRGANPINTVIPSAAASCVLRLLSKALLRELLSSCCEFAKVKTTSDGQEEQLSHPENWCVNAVFDYGFWPVPELVCVVTHPVLLTDGSILLKNGYDAASRLYVSMPSNLDLSIPDRPTRQDAIREVETIKDVIRDFPFKTSAHMAAWFAALLTPLTRFSFPGPTPFFLIDGNVAGVGKGLLADVISIIVRGRVFSTMSYTNDRDELRKKITALAMECEQMVMWDNLAGSVGNDVFDSVLTSTWWKDRLLGGNTNYDGPLYVSWYGTGNNVQLTADLCRRTCHIRLETREERPELKSGFKFPNLRAHLLANRGRLLTAALTILRAWHVEGCPTYNLSNWGSCEGWSGVVRESIVFAGLPDPGLTREELRITSDRDSVCMIAIIEGLRRLDPVGRGLTAAEVIKKCKDRPEENAELASALEEQCYKLDGRTLGGKFKQFQGRNFGGWMIEKATEDRKNTSRWRVTPVSIVNSAEMASPPTHSTSSMTPTLGNARFGGAQALMESNREKVFPSTPAPAMPTAPVVEPLAADKAEVVPERPRVSRQPPRT